MLEAIAAIAALTVAWGAGCGSVDADPSASPAPPPDAGTLETRAALDAAASDPARDAEAPGASPDADPPDAALADDASLTASESSAETGPQVCGFAACAPGAPCPDLVVDEEDLSASILIATQTFAPTDCAVVEGCITTTGTRRLLRFDTATANVGTADLDVGDPTENACFQYSDCHMHYHFKGVGDYTLYQADGVTVAATGHKQGFCLEDVEPYDEAPGPTPATPYTCTNQGLHVGWEDVYPNDIDCQWIDITGLAAGDYVLSVKINDEHYLPESNYDNDEAQVPVTIGPQ